MDNRPVDTYKDQQICVASYTPRWSRTICAASSLACCFVEPRAELQNTLSTKESLGVFESIITGTYCKFQLRKQVYGPDHVWSHWGRVCFLASDGKDGYEASCKRLKL
jgi:hypothetical protein